MATVVERERTMAAAVTHLDQDLTEEKAAHQIAMQEQKQHIAQLKEELQTIKSATTIDGRCDFISSCTLFNLSLLYVFYLVNQLYT